MKKFIALTCFALFTMAFLPLHTNAQGPCPDLVGTTCFGDCGGSNTINYMVPAGKNGAVQFCVEGLGGNYCGLLEAIATVSVNGSPVKSGDIDGGRLRFHAKAGDAVSVTVVPNVDPRILCIVLGSYSYQLSTRLR